jgi:Flp pilus assembly protein TadD
MPPLSAAAHRRRALALEFRGQYGEAVAAYHEAVRCDPEDADARIRLGLLLRELGQDEEANRTFEAALARRSGSASTRPLQQSFVWTHFDVSRVRRPEGSGV